LLRCSRCWDHIIWNDETGECWCELVATPEMRPYLVKSIARFNEARVCSEKGAEIRACGLIQGGLDMLQAGLGACQDPGGEVDWLRAALLNELVGGW